ncbi:hypothetical protein ONZ45_g14708 [Pleurotus djamor]|nr:hypothetical protein ONZ45_g14708 [Pleurotus djamor]
MASPPRDTRSFTSAAGYPGPINLLRSTIRTHGVSGLWLGHTGTLLREAGGNAAWFAVKETISAALIKRRLRKSSFSSIDQPPSVAGMTSPRPPRPPVKRSHRRNAEILPWESAVSGAIAGACGTVVSYPADTVKSAMQTSDELRSLRAPLSPTTVSTTSIPAAGFLATFKRMYASHGIRAGSYLLFMMA